MYLTYFILNTKMYRKVDCILGSEMDKYLSTMDNFIQSKSKSITFQLRLLRRILKFLSNDALKILVQAMVQSRLDYCNSLLFGVSKNNLNTSKLCCPIDLESSKLFPCNRTKETAILASL